MGVSLIAPRADSPRLPPNFRGVSAAPLPFPSNPFSFFRSFARSFAPPRPRGETAGYVPQSPPFLAGEEEGKKGGYVVLARLIVSRVSKLLADSIKRFRPSRPSLFPGVLATRDLAQGCWEGGGRKREKRGRYGNTTGHDRRDRRTPARNFVGTVSIHFFSATARRTEGKERRGGRKVDRGQCCRANGNERRRRVDERELWRRRETGNISCRGPLLDKDALFKRYVTEMQISHDPHFSPETGTPRGTRE